MKKATNESSVRSGRFGPADYVRVTVFGFALSALWTGLHSIILPLRLLDFVAESEKNTYLGLLTFVGLILAMAVQPVAGAASDRSGLSWGRRRPYILLGTAAVVALLPGVSLAGSFTALLAVYCLLQVSANSAHGPFQALIPDLVPEGRRGVASGVKSMLETSGGIALLYPLALLMDRYYANQGVVWLWLSLGMLAIILLGTMLVTIFMVKEPPRAGSILPPMMTLVLRSFRFSVKANPDFIWFLVSRLFTFMAFTTVQTFALYFLKDVVGVASPAEATAQFSIVVVAGVLAAAYPAGRLSDRVGRRPIVLASGLLGALGIAAVFLFQHSYGLIMVGAGVLGVSFGAFMSTNWALATDLVARGEEARYLGLVNMATAGGAGLARLIGPVIDFFNASSPGLGYQVMLLAVFAYFLAGSGLLLKVKVR
ncbi:MAG: MFS transporter [Chloroflexi bacterium]|nr:MFS transporter [Chloroflexota bacterium]